MDEDEEEDAEDPQELAPFEASKVCCQYAIQISVRQL